MNLKGRGRKQLCGLFLTNSMTVFILKKIHPLVSIFPWHDFYCWEAMQSWL